MEFNPAFHPWKPNLYPALAIVSSEYCSSPRASVSEADGSPIAHEHMHTRVYLISHSPR